MFVSHSVYSRGTRFVEVKTGERVQSVTSFRIGQRSQLVALVSRKTSIICGIVSFRGKDERRDESPGEG